jgi:hypothetical protein
MIHHEANGVWGGCDTLELEVNEMSLTLTRGIRPLVADKKHIQEMVAEQNRIMGFVIDPTAMAERAQEMILADGVRPEDNAFSRGIIEAREEYRISWEMCQPPFERV